MYTYRPLPDGRFEVLHLVGTCDARDEAALMVDFLNELERHPERRLVDECDVAALLRLERACGVEEVRVYERP